MFSRLKLIPILFRDFIGYNLIFTFVAAYFLLTYREISFPYLFWIKIIGFVVLAMGYYTTRRSRLCFYHNLGFSPKLLVTVSFVIDLILSLLIFIPTYALT